MPQDSGLYINDIWKPLINKYTDMPPLSPPCTTVSTAYTHAAVTWTSTCAIRRTHKAAPSRLQRHLCRGHTERLADTTPHPWIRSTPHVSNWSMEAGTRQKRNLPTRRISIYIVWNDVIRIMTRRNYLWHDVIRFMTRLKHLWHNVCNTIWHDVIRIMTRL